MTREETKAKLLHDAQGLLDAYEAFTPREKVKLGGRLALAVSLVRGLTDYIDPPPSAAPPVPEGDTREVVFVITEQRQNVNSTDDIPADVQAELMRCATSNGRISYDYLCDVWRRGRAMLAPLLQRAVDGLSQGACYTCGAEPGCNIDCHGCKWVADAEVALRRAAPAVGEEGKV